MMDPILEELYATKEEIAHENGYDVRRMSATAHQFVETLQRAGWKFNILPAPPPDKRLQARAALLSSQNMTEAGSDSHRNIAVLADLRDGTTHARHSRQRPATAKSLARRSGSPGERLSRIVPARLRKEREAVLA